MPVSDQKKVWSFNKLTLLPQMLREAQSKARKIANRIPGRY
jgi:hypothetical protein